MKIDRNMVFVVSVSMYIHVYLIGCMATHSMKIYCKFYTPRMNLNGLFIKPSNITEYWTKYYIVVL